MEPAAFVRASRLVIVAGKGGVGKTTVACALARLAARLGLRVLLVDVDGARGIASAFGVDDDLRYGERTLLAGEAGSIQGRRLTPDDALIEYLSDRGMKRLASRLRATGALDVIATAAPGIRDILILGKVKQIVAAETFDLVVLDTPASGHAITFLGSARGLADAVKGGPIRRQADEVLDLLTDHRRCQVVLVTLPEETPVNEAIETAFALEDRVGVALGPVVVNACLAPVPKAPKDALRSLASAERSTLEAALAFETGRAEGHDRQRRRLAEELPLSQLILPQLPGVHIGPELLDTLADSLADAVTGLAAHP